MPWRSRLIASTRSSRSAVSVVVLGLDLAQFLLGAQVDRAEPLAVAAQPFELAPRSRATSGSARPARCRRAPRPPAGSTSSISWISWAMSASRRLAPSTRSSARAGFLAGGAQRFERGAGGAVGLGERVLGLGQAVGGGAAGGFGGFDLADQRAALLGEGPRRVFERARSAWPRRCASSSVAICARRARAALAPGLPVGGDRREAAVGELGLARERLRFGAHLGEHARACRRCRRATAASWPSRSAAGGSAASACSASRLAGLRFVAARGQARLAPRPAPRCARASRLASRSAAACASRAAVGLALRARASASRAAASAAPAAARSACAASTRACAWPRPRARAASSSASMSARRLRSREPARGAGRRMRGGGKAVPAPEVAFARNQPLAGLEQRRRGAAPSRALDHADLRQPARQLGRRLDVARERLDAVRQRRIGRIDRGAGPAHRRGRIDRRIEVVAERGAERLLVALLDGERVDHRRPQVLGLDRQQLGERLGLGFEPLRRGARPRRAGRARHRAPGAPRHARPRRAAPRLRPRRRRPAPPRPRAASAARSARRSGLRAGELGLDCRRSRRRAAPPRSTCSRAACSSWLRRAVRSASAPVSSAKIFSAAPARYRLRPPRHRRRRGARALSCASRLSVSSSAASRASAASASAASALLALDVVGELHEPPVELGHALLGALLLALERLARDQQPLQRGGGLRLGFAQRRQRRRAPAPGAWRPPPARRCASATTRTPDPWRARLRRLRHWRAIQRR